MKDNALRPEPSHTLRVLRLLMSPLFTGALDPAHRADLAKSGLTGETIRAHRFMSVPPDLLERLLGFDVPAVVSAMLLPFPDPRGGWLKHVRVKVFPTLTGRDGHTTKYLGPRGWPPRVYFPQPTLSAVLDGDGPVWLVEGAKKSLAVAQLGLPAIGFEGVEGWHAKGTTTLLEDFDRIPLRGRLVELVPDGDVASNPAVARGITQFSEALQSQGARVRIRLLPIAQGVAA